VLPYRAVSVSGGDVAADEILSALRSALAGVDVEGSATVLGAGADDLRPGRAYLEALAGGGWAVPTWPVEYGGRGASPSEAAAIARALAALPAPDLYPFLVGLHVVAPTLIAVASPQQCARWLPPIRTGEEIWCQLFSEPGAGSDLANVSTRATYDGTAWHVTGQKVWSSRAHYADWGFLLARTDPDRPKHEGITAFAIDMRARGVRVRPLRQMNGDAHFSEVFLDDVVVPDDDRIGERGAGWPIARIALANERGAVGVASSAAGPATDRLLDLARSYDDLDPIRRDAVMQVFVEREVARLTARRARDMARSGTPGPEGSGQKLRHSATLKQTAAAAAALLGAEALLAGGEWGTLLVTAPSISIRGGTDEIQRNIVGERVLGLPPEPRADVDRPWSEIPH
jgi:alkylation response protein AidB-like acyl-CoA dehydrogenase